MLLLWHENEAWKQLTNSPRSHLQEDIAHSSWFWAFLWNMCHCVYWYAPAIFTLKSIKSQALTNFWLSTYFIQGQEQMMKHKHWYVTAVLLILPQTLDRSVEVKVFSQRPWHLTFSASAAHSTKLTLLIANSTFCRSVWAYPFLHTLTSTECHYSTQVLQPGGKLMMLFQFPFHLLLLRMNILSCFCQPFVLAYFWKLSSFYCMS